jgi:phosphohistidine phosphatase SixA
MRFARRGVECARVQGRETGRGWLPTAVCLAVMAGLSLPWLVAGPPPAGAADDDRLWSLLKGGGQIVLIRHASTVPGVGDPPGFRVEDCATQRNLSEAGREEARRIGAAFRQRGVPVGQVLSSRWCRCLETARLAFGSVEPWPALDSFFADRSREPEQTRAVRERAGQPAGPGNLILVTHQVNITALTGIVPSQGELVILTPRDGGFTVAGRLSPAATR